jgi:hypothetical protein
MNRAIAYGVAGLFASVAAGLAAIQTFVPQLTFRYWIGDPAGRYVDAFVHGFLGAFITALIGILNEPSLATWKSAVIGLIVGAITAGLQGVEDVVMPVPVPPVRHPAGLPSVRRGLARTA